MTKPTKDTLFPINADIKWSSAPPSAKDLCAFIERLLSTPVAARTDRIHLDYAAWKNLKNLYKDDE